MTRTAVVSDGTDGGRCARRAFTLVELVVVLTILAVVAGVTAPALLMTRTPDRLNTAARAAAVLLDRARRTAIERGERVTITVDPATGRYRVEAGGVDGRDSVAAGTLALDGVTLSSASPRIRVSYSALGVVVGDASLDAQLLVAHDGARSAAVTLDPWTGAARVAR